MKICHNVITLSCANIRRQTCDLLKSRSGTNRLKICRRAACGEKLSADKSYRPSTAPPPTAKGSFGSYRLPRGRNRQAPLTTGASELCTEMDRPSSRPGGRGDAAFPGDARHAAALRPLEALGIGRGADDEVGAALNDSRYRRAPCRGTPSTTRRSRGE